MGIHWKEVEGTTLGCQNQMESEKQDEDEERNHTQSQKANFGETFSEEAEKVIGYLVAKNILSFLCAHENNTFNKHSL